MSDLISPCSPLRHLGKPAKRDEQAMKKQTPKDRVLAKVPHARCVDYGLFGCAYAVRRGNNGALLGWGGTRGEAWKRADYELQRA